MSAKRASARALTHHDNETSLALYDAAAVDAAATVIKRYSNSFGAGARLLAPATRSHIASIYAMVRVADEIVDTYRGDDAGAQLDAFEAEVHAAMGSGFSTNLIAHAFALTARECGIGQDLTVPFFESMRMDLSVTEHTPASFDRYVYGSAEVIGEMCLNAFIASETVKGKRLPAPSPEVREGARRLGAAYQKVNFLRDIAMDDGTLGRTYFPGITAANLSDEALAGLVADCKADIVAAEACLPALPRRARIAVQTTVDIYARLLRKISRTPAQALCHTRVRVPDPIKLAIVARNLVPGVAPRRLA